MLKSAPLSCVNAIMGEAKRIGIVQPTGTSYGITSDPIREYSHDSLMAAVLFSVKEPWRAIKVYQDSCDMQDCKAGAQWGYLARGVAPERGLTVTEGTSHRLL